MTSATTDVFLERLIASQLLDQDKLATCRNASENNPEGLTEAQLLDCGLTRFQIRQLRAGATNFFIGKYVITDCIGRGGNGIVFKARHRLMRRDVALKTLDTRSLHHANDAVARFKREIDIVAQLEHVNVVRALDVLQTRTHTYLVLEYVAGQDLGAIVKQRGSLPVQEAVNFALQAARGLHYAHEQGIIHRDLKPENLLLTKDGVVKVSDLGLARFFEDKEDNELTMKGMCLGTPEYMAPEQAENAHLVDRRSDIYSLGATLFHLLTGQLPVMGKSYLHRLQHLLTAPPRPLLEARPDAPVELAAIVDRMRDRDPANRPKDAEEVIRLLEPFIRQAPVEDPNHWSARRKADLVLEVLASQAPMETICASHGVNAADFSRWRDTFIGGGIRALSPGNSDDVHGRIGELLAKIGLQAMEIETLRKKA